jgi:hypothetical protein
MDELRMSAKERIRLEALWRVKRGELTIVAAAELMGLSVRQSRRAWKRFKGHGDAGLVHGLRGRVSNRRLSQELADRILKLHQEQPCRNCRKPTFACEKLAEQGLALSPNTLSALLKERGLWRRRRRRDKHRKRRERRACFGSMVQMDGSVHDWFEGRCGPCVLMVLIDDATSWTYARFYPAESLEGVFDVFGRWVKGHGLPRALYVDRHSIYRDEDHPEHPTQFGRAMKELGVELIQARSPQAKGRVERRNAVFQDRLVKEMRLRDIRSMEQGNAFLEGMFLADMNRRYAISPREETDLHRAAEADLTLEEVLCVQEVRVVGRDWCVRWRNRYLQIASCHAGLNLPRRRVLVKHVADGRLILEHKGEALRFVELAVKPAARKAKKAIVNNRRWKPPEDHPWKAGLDRRSVPRARLAPAAPEQALHAEKKKGTG